MKPTQIELIIEKLRKKAIVEDCYDIKEYDVALIEETEKNKLLINQSFRVITLDNIIIPLQ